jgi:hypothetical protein
MAFLSAIFSLLSRKIGDLLQALFGWSITGLFGRLRSSKQTALSVALILAIVWPLLVIGCFLPDVAAWAVAFIPLHQWLGDTLLRVLWIVLAVISPIVVGLITAWVAPSRRQKGSVFRTILSGFPLTVGLFLSFLMTFFIVPALKLIAMARRWEDEHVFLQPKEGEYHRILNELAQACQKAGVQVTEWSVPKVMQAPVRVLRFFARGGIEPLVNENPRMLRGDGLELYLYPADLMLRGRNEQTRRVRAAMLREMTQAPAYLTEDHKAQKLEDRIKGAWETLARHRDLAEVREVMQQRARDLSQALDEANVPYDDFVLLFSNLQRLERVVHAEPSDPAARTAAIAAKEGTMPATDPNPETSTVTLIKDAVDEAKALFKTEIALARDEAKKQIAEVKVAGIAMSSAAVAALLGLAMLLVALVLTIAPHPVTALVAGITLLVGAGLAGLVGYLKLPKKPLEQTQERLEINAQVLKETVA